MGTLFGTDGIRGVANETLDNVLAYRVGLATALNLYDELGKRRWLPLARIPHIFRYD